MVLFARHAVVEFSEDWSVHAWHCVLCDYSSSKKDDLRQHTESHQVAKCTSTLISTATLKDGRKLEHTNTYMLPKEGGGDNSFSMKIKLEPVEAESEGEQTTPDAMGETEEQKSAKLHTNKLKPAKNNANSLSRKRKAVERTVFACSECNMRFYEIDELDRHILQEHASDVGNGNILCQLCDKTFLKYADLDKHTLLEHTRSPLPVPPPPRQALSKKAIIDKMEFLTDPNAERKFQCKVCKNCFKMRHHLSDHIKAIHQQLHYYCEVCDKKYKSGRALKMHLLDHQDAGIATNVAPYNRCQICRRAFLQRHQFENHVRVRHGTMMFPCRICDKRFTHEELLHTHMNNHKTLYRFKCQICQVCFTTVKDRSLHIAVHASEIQVELAELESPKQQENSDAMPGVPVICSVCGLTFANDDALKVHCIKDHNDPVIFSCNGCHDESASYLDLMNHIRDQCKNSARVSFLPHPTVAGSDENGVEDEETRDSNGTEEDNSLTGSNLFTKRTDVAYNSTPKDHGNRRKSTRVRKFRCEECDESFGFAHHLKDHRSAYHTGVIWGCKKCGKQFKRKNSLKEHACETLVCELCKKLFEHNAHLVNHLQVVHDMQEQVQELAEENKEEKEHAEEGILPTEFKFELVQEADDEANADAEAAVEAAAEVAAAAVVAAAESTGEQQDIKPIILPFIIQP